MARLAAEVHLRSAQYAKRPNRKFVSASTREYAYANYLRAWVDRAEKVGNLNYPDEARQRRLGGQVVISVGVRRDGDRKSTRLNSSHSQISYAVFCLKKKKVAKSKKDGGRMHE